MSRWIICLHDSASFIANFVNLIVIFQQPSNEILEDIGAIAQLRPEVIFSHGLLSPNQHLLRTLGVGIMFKWPISPQQVLYPANLHRIVLTEPVAWEYPRRVISMESFPIRQFPTRAISVELSRQNYLRKLVPNRDIFSNCLGLPNRPNLITSPESSSQRK